MSCQREATGDSIYESQKKVAKFKYDFSLVTSYFKDFRTISDISPSGVLIEWSWTGSWPEYNYVYVDSADMSYFTVCSNIKSMEMAYSNIHYNSYDIVSEAIRFQNYNKQWEKVKEETVSDTIHISKEQWEIINRIRPITRTPFTDDYIDPFTGYYEMLGIITRKKNGKFNSTITRSFNASDSAVFQSIFNQCYDFRQNKFKHLLKYR